MSAVRSLGAALVAVGLVAGTAALSRVPFTLSSDSHALLRLSWRVEGVTVETCRTLSAEELARLPVHMRTPTSCVGEGAWYILELDVDGRRVLADTVRPAGARGDRPLAVLVEVPVAPGEHDARVRFDALLPEGAEGSDGVPSLSWEGRFRVEAGEVALVTLDGTARALETRLPVR